ncbi:hypothetical protein B0H67DRAFT_599001 [Lasiosphaeris hirsuta]|uniref:F-box domain-containing protein n=1 Tax=Lasiosphaeris hirsuta TaxID=260670 RepID=A0AA40B1U2_9PEZI|nr:hypothetical protein B0H67DRAFT_599001 [Lasiosphaeris hirsuta]
MATPMPRTGRDLISPLSDELLLRILSFLPLPHLLAVAPVSRLFYRLAGDSQLWKALYYARFVLPRALRIPGFRDGVAGTGAGHKLHYSGRRTLWADGRRGGVVCDEDDAKRRRNLSWIRGGTEDAGEDLMLMPMPKKEEVLGKTEGVNWKRQYKIRYNWSRGKCAVEELRIAGNEMDHVDDQPARKVLVKVVEGIALTVDKASGVRAWDLKTRRLLAQVVLEGDDDNGLVPSCVAMDDSEFGQGKLDLAVGFLDGSFGVWRFFTSDNRLVRLYKHKKSSNGELIAMAFSYPYLLTATASVLISLYTFEVPSKVETDREAVHTESGPGGEQEDKTSARNNPSLNTPGPGTDALPAPYLLTSLNSHTSRPPLALSIRNMTAATIASIAYTFSTRQGWSIGIQDLHIRLSGTTAKSTPEITTTRIAYTTPVNTGGPAHSPSSPPSTSGRPSGHRLVAPNPPSRNSVASSLSGPGPTTLCYTHPYLLATLPDNTLVLHTCTSNASSLSISRGIRLWGHTSGISDAEITARGKAVSVSSRGEEMRVWELEGRSNGLGSRSVEIRPGQSPTKLPAYANADGTDSTWDERRNWVGFDDEMVIVLKEREGGGSESLMVYDFT